MDINNEIEKRRKELQRLMRAKRLLDSIEFHPKPAKVSDARSRGAKKAWRTRRANAK